MLDAAFQPVAIPGVQVSPGAWPGHEAPPRPAPPRPTRPPAGLAGSQSMVLFLLHSTHRGGRSQVTEGGSSERRRPPRVPVFAGRSSDVRHPLAEVCLNRGLLPSCCAVCAVWPAEAQSRRGWSRGHAWSRCLPEARPRAAGPSLFPLNMAAEGASDPGGFSEGSGRNVGVNGCRTVYLLDPQGKGSGIAHSRSQSPT